MAESSMIVGPSTSKDLNLIPEGRVGQVCKEWLVREDSNLAYQLQHEEISKHYTDNRVKNQIVRDDIPLAKELQQKEFREAQRRRYEQLMDEISQEDIDAQVARQLQQIILNEEEEKRKATEEADERYAMKLLEKEKARQRKKRMERERQQVAQVSAEMGIVQYPTIKSSTSGGQIDRRLSTVSNVSIMLNRPESYQRVLMEDEHELDMSEFCAPPPPGLTPEELNVFIEQQDAEIARLVELQENKRKRDNMKQKQASIEAQDYELACALQKLEKERLRKIKQKIRARQAAQQNNNADGQSTQSSVENAFDFESSVASRDYQRTSTPISPETSLISEQTENVYDIPENHLTDHNRPESSTDSITYETAYETLVPSGNPASLSPFRQAFHNIAMDLDPTYQRRMIESSVDDDGSIRSGNEYRSRLARSNDSLDKLNRNRVGSEFVAHSSTGSSRSSSASHRSNNSQRSQPSASTNPFSTLDPSDPNYAPPLPPPRDMSLVPRTVRQDLTPVPVTSVSSMSTAGSAFLPPHHPQHPNANRNVEYPLPGKYSPNRHSAFYPPPVPGSSSSSSSPQQNSVPPIIPGQRRLSSIEKEKNTKNTKNKQIDTCKTQ